MKNHKTFKAYYTSLYNYFAFKIYLEKTQYYPWYKRWGIEFYKIIAIAWKKFWRDRGMDRSTALSYYSSLAVVPILAMAFGLAEGFGLGPVLQNIIDGTAMNKNTLWNTILEFSQNMLKNANGGIVAGVGVLILFWIVINVLSHIELALNDVWGIKKPRTLLRKGTDYVTIIVLTPMILFVAFSAKLYLSTHLQNITDIGMFQTLIKNLLQITPYIAAFIIIFLLYMVLPNKRVPLWPTAIASLLTTILFLLLQYFYVRFQVYMNTYNVVYGSFAALPLFLIWLRFSWTVIFFGAELAFSLDKKDHYFFENDYKHLSEYRKKMYAIYMTYLISRNFQERKGGMSIRQLSKEMEAFQPHLYEVAQILTESSLLSRVYINEYKYQYEAIYQPAFDIHTLTIFDVLNALDLHDYQEALIPDDAHKIVYGRIENSLEKINELIRTSPENVLVKDLNLDWKELLQEEE